MAANERSSKPKGERHDLGAAAPLSTTKYGQARRRPRTAWIEHPILPRFCFDDTRPEGGLLVVYPPEAAEVRGV